MSVWQMPTIAVLMHFVITPTDPSIARVHQDIQEMDKNAQVNYQWKFCSLMAAETSLLIIAMQRQGGSKGYGLGG